MLLKDILFFTRDGEWGEADSGKGRVEMKVIRGTDFETVRFNGWESVPTRFIPENIAERKRLQPSDILIETAGGSKDRPTGRTVILKPGLFQSTTLPITCASFSRFLRVNTALAVPEYVYWHLQWLYVTGKVAQYQVQHTGIARFQYTTFAENINAPSVPP